MKVSFAESVAVVKYLVATPHSAPLGVTQPCGSTIMKYRPRPAVCLVPRSPTHSLPEVNRYCMLGGVEVLEGALEVRIVGIGLLRAIS